MFSLQPNIIEPAFSLWAHKARLTLSSCIVAGLAIFYLHRHRWNVIVAKTVPDVWRYGNTMKNFVTLACWNLQIIGWLGCIHRVNRVNSRNGSAMMTALWILSWLLLWLLLLDIRIHGDLCVEPYDSSFHLWIILYKSWLDLWVEKIKSEQLFQKAITAELRGQSLKLYKKSSRLELRKHFSAKELLITVISHRMT